MRNFNLLIEIGALHQVVVERQIMGTTMYCVYNEARTRSFGCYTTRAQAEARLRQIERFADD